MDLIDIKLLAAMEKNARISLKTLARDLNVKTSTIYHRLHRLKERKILDRFTVVINPEEIGLTMYSLLSIRLKKMVIGKLDLMFLESFAKFLSDQFDEIMFTSVGNDEQIWSIATFRDEEHFKTFESQLQQNPYVESFHFIQFNKIIKGKKIFSFLPQLIQADIKGEMINDETEIISDVDEDEDEDEKFTNEVFF
jgi:Lrp/AsnC family transcriptional regulator for asnA, asnC and gidA